MNAHTRPLPEYASGHSRAQLAISFFVAAAVLGAAALVSGYMQIGLLSRMMEGQYVSEMEVASNDSRQGFIGILQVITLITAAITFLIWFHRAHRNLPSLGACSLDYSPGWAVGAFFVPILNLFRPFQIAGEIWKASDPKVDLSEGSAWKKAPLSPLVGWWWGLFLADAFVGRAASNMLASSFTADKLHEATVVMLVSDAIGIASALVTIALIKTIDERQEERRGLPKTQVLERNTS